MVKKGYMKTLEVLFAIVVTVIFFVILVPVKDVSEEKDETFSILGALLKDSVFREAAISLSEACYNASSSNNLTEKVEQYLFSDYTYHICLNVKKDGLPEEKIFIETSFITGNITDYKHRQVRLYYWLP